MKDDLEHYFMHWLHNGKPQITAQSTQGYSTTDKLLWSKIMLAFLYCVYNGIFTTRVRRHIPHCFNSPWIKIHNGNIAVNECKKIKKCNNFIQAYAEVSLDIKSYLLKNCKKGIKIFRKAVITFPKLCNTEQLALRKMYISWAICDPLLWVPILGEKWHKIKQASKQIKKEKKRKGKDCVFVCLG